MTIQRLQGADDYHNSLSPSANRAPPSVYPPKPKPNSKTVGHHFFLPLARPAPVVDETLWARDVEGDVALLPAPDLMALTFLF